MGGVIVPMWGHRPREGSPSPWGGHRPREGSPSLWGGSLSPLGVSIPVGGVTIPVGGVTPWPQLWAPGSRGRGAVRLAGLVRGSLQPP